MFSSLPKDPLEGENSREKFPVELECFWFRLYGTGSPPSSSSNTAGPPSEFQLFGQGIPQNSCCSRLGFNSVAQNFSTFPSPFSGNILCSEKPKKSCCSPCVGQEGGTQAEMLLTPRFPAAAAPSFVTHPKVALSAARTAPAAHCLEWGVMC